MDTWALATVAFLLLVFAALSHRLKRSYVTLAIFFTSTGLLAGPALGLLDLELGSEPIKLLAEATLTLVLFSDASRISIPALRREFSVPARLLGLGLPLTIAAGTVAGVTVLPGVSLVEALVLAVMLACTDAALGQAVVTDRRIPSRIRQGLNVESGLNDGLCVPLFFIAIAIAEADEGALSARGALEVVAEEIGWGLVGGVRPARSAPSRCELRSGAGSRRPTGSRSSRPQRRCSPLESRTGSAEASSSRPSSAASSSARCGATSEARSATSSTRAARS